MAEGGEPESAHRLAALRNEVQAGLVAARRDRTLLDALADVRTSKEDLGTAGADAAYARAFREAGLDVDGVPPAEVGAALKARPASVAVAAAAALDDWALVRRQDGQPAERLPPATGGGPRRRPRPVPRQGPRRDPGTRRQGPRGGAADARGRPRRRPSCPRPAPCSWPRRCAASRRSSRPSPCSAPSSDVTRTTFWANYVLADALSELRPAAREEAVRYYTAARSLRPETAHVLAHLLDEMGRGDEALAVFADLAARRPDDATQPGLLRPLSQGPGPSRSGCDPRPRRRRWSRGDPAQAGLRWGPLATSETP